MGDYGKGYGDSGVFVIFLILILLVLGGGIGTYSD